MSDVLRLSCTIENEAARNATENFAKTLKKVFEQYQKLLDQYLKLLKRCEDANIDTTDLLPLVEKDKDVDTSSQTSVESTNLYNVAARLVIPDTPSEYLSSMFESTSQGCTPDIDFNGGDSVSVTSPVLAGRRSSRSRRSTITPTRIKFDNVAGKSTTVNENNCILKSSFQGEIKVPVKTEDNNHLLHEKCENVIECTPVSKVPKRLGVSKLYNVDTTLLQSGKKLKQSKLVFLPAEEITDITFCENQDLKPFPVHKSPAPKKSNVQSFHIPCENKSTEDEIIESSPKREKSQVKVKSLMFKRKSPTKSSNSYKKENIRVNEFSDSKCNDIKLPLKQNYSASQCSSSMYTSTQKDRSYLIKKSKTLCSLHGSTESELDISNCLQSPILFDIERSELSDHFTNVWPDVATLEKRNIAEQDGKSQKRKFSESIGTSTSQDETFFALGEKAKKENEYKLRDSDFKERLCVNKAAAAAPSAVKRSLMTSFDIVPENKEIQVTKPSKNQADRAKMNGVSCWECEQYYKNFNLPEGELKKKQNQCSRHRVKYDERQETPAGFWDPIFPATMSSTYQDD